MKHVSLLGHHKASLRIAESRDSEVTGYTNSYPSRKPNCFPDLNICSAVLIGSWYPGSIRNVVRYAWNTVLIATL